MTVPGPTEAPAKTGRAPRSDALRNREMLLEAASAAFAAKGAEAPLEEIARGAGVGIGTLYRHFPTRDALVVAVYRHEVDILAAAAAELLATMPADQALAEWLQRFVGHVTRKRGIGTALKAMLGPDASLFQESRARLHAAAASLLAAGAAAGTIRGDVEARDLMRGLIGVCMSVDQSDWPQGAERLVGLLFDGLRHGASGPRA